MHPFRAAVADLAPAVQADGSSGSLGVVVPLIVGVVIVLRAFWLLSLIDVLSWPATTWDAAKLSKARWVMRIAFLGEIGAFLYVTSPRRTLRAAYAAIRWGGDGSSPVVAPGQRADG